MVTDQGGFLFGFDKFASIIAWGVRLITNLYSVNYLKFDRLDLVK